METTAFGAAPSTVDEISATVRLTGLHTGPDEFGLLTDTGIRLKVCAEQIHYKTIQGRNAVYTSAPVMVEVLRDDEGVPRVVRIVAPENRESLLEVYWEKEGLTQCLLWSPGSADIVEDLLKS